MTAPLDATDVPTCADCSEPAVYQVHIGTTITPGPPMRRYAWMCDRCALEWEREKAWSQSL